MKYTGPYRLITSGDPGQADASLGHARFLLGKTIETMQLAGMQQGAGRRVLEDGTELFVRSFAGVNEIYITAPGKPKVQDSFVTVKQEPTLMQPPKLDIRNVSHSVPMPDVHENPTVHESFVGHHKEHPITDSVIPQHAPHKIPEIPVVQIQNPKIPVAEIPVAQIPEAEIPVAQIPVAEIPVAQIPVAEIPVAQIPVAQIPVAQIPEAQIPVAEIPVAEIPVAQIPVAEIPVAQIPEASIPVAEIPVADIPLAQIPDAKIPVAQIPEAPIPIDKIPDVEIPNTEIRMAVAHTEIIHVEPPSFLQPEVEEPVIPEIEYVDAGTVYLFAFDGSNFLTGAALGSEWKTTGDIGFTPMEIANIGHGVFLAFNRDAGIKKSLDFGDTWEVLIDSEEKAPYIGNCAVAMPGKCAFFTGNPDENSSTLFQTGSVTVSDDVEINSFDGTTKGLVSSYVNLETRGYLPGMLGSPILNIGGHRLISFFSGPTDKDINAQASNQQKVTGYESVLDIFGNIETTSANAIFVAPNGTETIVLSGNYANWGFSTFPVLLPQSELGIKFSPLIAIIDGASTYLIDPNLMKQEMDKWVAGVDWFNFLNINGLDSSVFTASIEPYDLVLNHDYIEGSPKHVGSFYEVLVDPSQSYAKGWGIYTARCTSTWKIEDPNKPADKVINPEIKDEPYSSWVMMSLDNGETWKSKAKVPFSFCIWATCLGWDIIVAYAFTFSEYAETNKDVVGLALWRTANGGETWDQVHDDDTGEWLLPPSDPEQVQDWNDARDKIFPNLEQDAEAWPDFYDAVAFIDHFPQQNTVVHLGKKDLDDFSIWMRPGHTMVSKDKGETWEAGTNPFKAVGRPIALGKIPVNLADMQDIHGSALVGVSADIDPGVLRPSDQGGPGFFTSSNQGETWVRRGDMPTVSNVTHAQSSIDLAKRTFYKA